MEWAGTRRSSAGGPRCRPSPGPPPGPPQEGAQRPPETPGLSSFILLFPPWIIKIFFFFFAVHTKLLETEAHST